MINAKINGTPVEFLADSGAFFSMISPGNAQSLRLPTTPAPAGFSIRGINGTASASIVTVRSFEIADNSVPGVQFIVAGSETRGVGVVGQNILGIGDVDYDLPHGAIRLMTSQGCGKANLAYWAGGRTFSIIPIEPRSAQHPHTIGPVTVNGVSVRATFDTGASISILSLAAAARAGIRPGAPGVVDGGMIYGFGRKLVRTWIAPIKSFALGDGEQIANARIRFGAMDGDVDMLIGADFFIAHRIYVDNKDHRLFLTYEGGPIFNLKARYDGPGDATPAPSVVAVAADDAEGASRDGAIAMARNDLATAVADFGGAIAKAPTEPRYLEQRATAFLRQGKIAAARSDLDRAIGFKPDDVDARLSRAMLELRDRDRPGALADLDAADRAADEAAMQRLQLADLLTQAGAPQRAIGQLDHWIKIHPDDVRKPEALNDRCWARALVGRDLSVAIRDCDAALRARPGTPAFLDSRGLAELRRGDLSAAIADYDAVLAKAPATAWSLYGRGIARRRRGDAAGSAADIEAAIAIQPLIAQDAKDYGVTP